MTAHPIEMIRWRDTHSQTGGWREIPQLITEMENAPIALTIGWVIHENADQVLMVGSHFTDWNQVGDCIAILKVQILNRYPMVEPVDHAEVSA